MKKMKTANRVGVWINTQEAYIITIAENVPPLVKKITSGIQSRTRIAGEKKPYTRFERAYGNSESHNQGRNIQFKRQYLKKLVDLLHDADYMYIVGPGKLKNELNNVIMKDGTIHGKIVNTEATQELTRRQIIEHIQNYFNSEAYRNDKKELRKVENIT